MRNSHLYPYDGQFAVGGRDDPRGRVPVAPPYPVRYVVLALILVFAVVAGFLVTTESPPLRFTVVARDVLLAALVAAAAVGLAGLVTVGLRLAPVAFGEWRHRHALACLEPVWADRDAPPPERSPTVTGSPPADPDHYAEAAEIAARQPRAKYPATDSATVGSGWYELELDEEREDNPKPVPLGHPIPSIVPPTAPEDECVTPVVKPAESGVAPPPKLRKKKPKPPAKRETTDQQIMTLLADLIKKWRRESKLTIVELAARTHLSYQALQRMENDEFQDLRLGDLLRIADALNWPADWLRQVQAAVQKQPAETEADLKAAAESQSRLDRIVKELTGSTATEKAQQAKTAAGRKPPESPSRLEPFFNDSSHPPAESSSTPDERP